MSSDFKKQIKQQLQQIKADNLYRTRQIVVGTSSTEPVVAGQQVLAFCSNDYLGLSDHPELCSAFIQAVKDYGVGSGSAHLVLGHTKAHHQLEERLADFCKTERALLFSTGYMANMGVISALTGKGDLIVEDKLNHASLIDGAQLSNAKLVRYNHLDANHLQKRVENSETGNILIATDGVFSMDGDVAPLKPILEVAKAHNAITLVDDAHGLGVTGFTGRGTLEEQGIDSCDVDVLLGTLGKGFGTAGAFIAASEDMVEFLIQKARTYIYTTAMPAAVAMATLKSIDLIESESWRRDHLRNLIVRFRTRAQQLGLNLMDSHTPIQPILIGDTAKTVEISNSLKQQGVMVTAIRPPTVPNGTARLRVTFSANHTEQQVDKLLDALERSIEQVGV